MFCTNCGRELKDDMLFCPNCGAKVEDYELFPDLKEEPAEEAAGPAVEAAEEAAGPAVEAAEEAPSPPEDAAEQAPRKKSKAPLIILIALVVLAAAGYFIYQNLDSTKYGRLRKQIDAAMEQKDYAAAQPLIEEAFDYGRDTEDLQEYLRQCKLDQIYKLYDSGDLREFIKAAEAHVNDFPKSGDELDVLIEESYLEESAKVLETEDAAKIKELRTWLADAYGTGRYPRLKDEISWVDTQIEYIGLKKIFSEFTAGLQSLFFPVDGSSAADSGYIEGFDLIRKELLRGGGKYRSLIMSDSKMKYYYPLILDADRSGNRWGFYYFDNRFFMYYGQYKGNKREGSGTWICADNQLTSATWREYIAEGTWTDDKPNGQFTEYRRTKYTASDEIEIMKAQPNVRNGLYDGEVSMSLNDSKMLRGTFADGHPYVIRTIDNGGEKRDVIFESENGAQYISIPSGSVQTRGIYGYGK